MKHLAIILFLIAVIVDVSSAQHYVYTYTGNGSIGFANGFLDSATFNNPFGLCRDRLGNIFLADGNNCIRKIAANGLAALMPVLALPDGRMAIPTPLNLIVRPIYV